MPVVEASQPSAARQAARELAERIGFAEADSYRVGIVATELATNLVKHATRGGAILVRATADDPVKAVELIGIDRGPGMANVDQSLSDGHSTVGSSGNGLGAIRRLSEEFDVHSIPNRGTAVYARLHAGRAARAPAAFDVAAVSIPKDGETACGDSWMVRRDARSMTALLADGLGHGLLAAEAAQAAVAVMRAKVYQRCEQAMTAIHDALRHTRGAAAAVLQIDRDAEVVRFAGVGNVAAHIVADGHVRQAISHNGTLGHQAPHIREYVYPWRRGGIVVMHSDGVTAHWGLESYPGLTVRQAAMIAAVLYRDFSRGRDDATVLVARETP